MPGDLEFEEDVRRRIYEYVERNGVVKPEAVRDAVRVDADGASSKPSRSGAATVRLSPSEFAAHVAALTEAGYLREDDGRLRLAVEASAERFELDDGTQVTVRLAREADSDGVQAVMQAVADERTSIVAESVAEALYDEPVLRHTRRRSRVVFVATIGEADDDAADDEPATAPGEGEVVGWVHLQAPELSKLRHTAELTVGVASDRRGQGIGGRLLQRGLDWADEQGYRKVYQSVPATNEAAVEFLEAHGWAVEATREDHYLVDDDYVDEVMLATWREE
jgi:ribosomal protein S18 acetylase RimI-like enzyme